jgi:3-oxoacyl-[acyl-carrier-protein] synthase III
MNRPVYISGTGSFLPGEPIPFDSIEDVLGPLREAPAHIQRWMTSTHETLKQLLAVKFFHYAIDPLTRKNTEDCVTMAVKAAYKAISMAGIDASDIDLICYGSPHQDQMPTASVRIQESLGIERCDELSIHANCTSAYKALYIAWQLIRSGQNKTALVLSANMASSELRSEYYNQSKVDKESLFLRWFLCDGAGAVILTADSLPTSLLELESAYIESVGGKRPSLMYNNRPAYWMNPVDEFNGAFHHLRQRFRNELSTSVFQESDGSVFKNGLRRMLQKSPVSLDSIRYFQINLPARHIAESVIDECVEIGISRDAYYTNLDAMGYCGPPMVFICLDQILRYEPKIPGNRILSFVTEVSKFMQAGYVARML